MNFENPYAVTDFKEDHFDRPPANVPDYLVWSIFATILCCVPVGIAAIVYSTMANGAKGQGNYQLALSHANKAKMYLIISVICGIIVFAISFSVNFLGAIDGVGH